MTTQKYLTKTKYLHGLQCQKRLWYEMNHPERGLSPSKAQHFLFSRGTEVGALSRDLFPEGILISARSFAKSVEQTQIAIRDGASCVFEASFDFDNTGVKCDILQRDGDSWNLIEVKMSTSVKHAHLPDLAIQKYVLTACGIPISKTQLMHINDECTYPDLSDLFILEDVTDRVDSLMENVPNDIETFRAVLDADSEPDVRIGKQCDDPYPCPFKTHCWEDVPENSIFTIPRLSWEKKDALIESDIFQLSELPENISLTDNQQAYVDYVLRGQPQIDTEAIEARLSDLEYPIHFFDFETDNPPVPKFQGLRPYQHLPFQYSCHIWQSDGTVTHHEYLHTDPTDPRLPLVESLLDTISDQGSVVVYYASFENQRLEDLAEFLPQYAQPLRSIQSRLWDQLVIFRNHYKHPGFEGSNSLKSVLPVLGSSLHYDDLDVQDGIEAQAVWQLMLDSNSEREREEMIRNLKAYCKLDTQAMVDIHKVLLKHINMSKIKAVAEQSWWRKTSKRRLAEDHSLTEAQIDELRATPEYQKVVESLMLGQRSPQSFEKWVKKYKNMPQNFGNRMGLDPGAILGMIKRVRQAHADIAAGKATVPEIVVNPSRKKVDGNIEMKLRFCESEIDDLADRYTERQSVYYREREKQVIGLRDAILQRGYLTTDDLQRVASWKSQRRASLTLENSDNFIKEVTAQAFTSTDDTDDWEKLISLTRLEGIGEPTASAILHLFDQCRYPILDIHALWSVGLAWEKRTSYPFWLEYIEFCRNIAGRNSVSMRHLDRALWRFSFDHRKQERAC